MRHPFDAVVRREYLKMEYKNKFMITQDEALTQNEKCLKDALDALYATYVLADTVAAHRGKAIQAINSMARALGFQHLVRND